MLRAAFLFVCGFVGSSRSHATKLEQAHLPLGHDKLPHVEEPPLSGVYGGAPIFHYPSGTQLDGDPVKTVKASLHRAPTPPTTPFQFWDLNRPKGPSIFECPDRFVLESRGNRCVFHEFARAEQSCPYGSFRQADRRCVQIDSVPVERTCPFGFQYFMKGCIRRTQRPPVLSCPVGYSQLSGACYSLSSIEAIQSCPSDEFVMDVQSGKCIKEEFADPVLECHPDASNNNIALSNSARSSSKRQLIGMVHPPLCQRRTQIHPLLICPTDFHLTTTTHSSNRLVFNASDINIECVKMVVYAGELQCKDHGELSWPLAMDNVISRQAAENDLYRMARCRSSVANAISTPQIMFARETCSKKPIETLEWEILPANPFSQQIFQPVCTEIQQLAPKYSCPYGFQFSCEPPGTIIQEFLTQELIRENDPAATDPAAVLSSLSDDEPEPRSGSESTFEDNDMSGEVETISSTEEKLSSSQRRRISRQEKKRMLVGDELDSTEAFINMNDRQIQSCILSGSIPVCSAFITEPPSILRCPTGFYSMQKHLQEKQPQPELPASTTRRCHRILKADPDISCPFGKGNDKKCQVLMSKPIDSHCPPEYHLGTQNLPPGGKKRDLKNLPPPPQQSSSPFCELVEYADYQITCPEGYRRDRGKIKSSDACLAKKFVPPSILCPPGFMPRTDGAPISVGDPKACVKRLIVAPTIISKDERNIDEATACIITKEGKLSCGLERKYFALTEMDKQLSKGRFYKEKKSKRNR